METMTPKEYFVLCKIFLNRKRIYISFTDLARDINFSRTSLTFQHIVKILEKNNIIIDANYRGKVVGFSVDYPLLFEILKETNIYKLTEGIIHKQSSFVRTP